MLYNGFLMPGKISRTIQIVSHGPSCLDGVMAAAAVARFYDGHKVFTTLAGNNEADEVIGNLTLKSADGNQRPLRAALATFLGTLGFEVPEFASTEVRNSRGELVGEIVAAA